MLMQSEPTVPTVKIKRVISSDAHKIFNLWTRPELMAHWMSPYPGKVQCAAEADRVGRWNCRCNPIIQHVRLKANTW
jgi:uncharacterized protein YndB with AHSA1/START domain